MMKIGFFYYNSSNKYFKWRHWLFVHYLQCSELVQRGTSVESIISIFDNGY